LGIQEENESTEPTEAEEVGTSVSFKVGLRQPQLEGGSFLPDITAAVKQVADDVLDNIQLLRRDLMLTAASGGTWHS